jgi:perosamine synthetase
MKIPLGNPIFDKEMEEAAINALKNEKFVLGESVFKFEEEFAKYCGTDYAISTSSGTEALRIALVSSGIGAGKTVITTPASFIATSNAIIHTQAKPVFADIDLKTYTIDPKKIMNLINKNVKAIVPVHLYGYPCEMDQINEIAQKKDLIVIEDACQAHGATFEGKKAGNLGDIGCFSFYPSKNMTVCGDGGMLTTNNEKIAKQAAKMRDCGRKSQYVHDIIGYTSRLNNVNAAIGRIQLKQLDAWNECRRKIAEKYTLLLKDVGDLILPPKPTNIKTPVYHLYVIRSKQRDQLKVWLESKGISSGIHYPIPIHLQPIYQEMFKCLQGVYVQAEELSNSCLSIPIFVNIAQEDILFICEAIRNFFDKRC